ncbi:MAG: stage 0 sporulation family protein [Nitrospirae bacterium YQR-1]
MPDVIGVRFKRCGKIYDYELEAIPIARGDLVVVESSFGLAIGSVVTEAKNVEVPHKELKKVIRCATDEDLKAKADNDSVEREAREYCQQRITARELPMKLVLTESTLDRKRIVFYFTADGRIDFRELVKDLASKFRTRIEMRQIGVRDETKVIGGLGICGREVCCNCFLSNFAPISIKMAKSQDLVLNPGKLSGLCGRLMCCLGFEVEPGSEPTGDVIELRDDGTTAITAVIDGKSLTSETIEDVSILAFLEKEIKTEKPSHKYEKFDLPESDVQQQASEQSFHRKEQSPPPALNESAKSSMAVKSNEPAPFKEQTPVKTGSDREKRFDPRKRRFHKKPSHTKTAGGATPAETSQERTTAVTPPQGHGTSEQESKKRKFHFKKHKKTPLITE